MSLQKSEYFEWEYIPLDNERLHLGMTKVCLSVPVKMLDAKEHAEYSLLTNPERKAEFLTSRVLIKEIAGKCGYQDYFHVQKDKDGKPFGIYEQGRCHLSISHSQKCITGIISEEKDVGLDIENAGRTVNPGLRKRILNVKEINLSEEIDLIRIWTVKESILKLLGTGLRKNMSDIILEPDKRDTFKTVVDFRKIRIQSFLYKKWWIAISLFE